MKRQSIVGFIRDNFSKIENMQIRGFYLQTIFEEIKKDFPEDFSFKTFKDCLYKIRKSSSTTDIKNLSNISSSLDATEKLQIADKNNKFNLPIKTPSDGSGLF